MPVFYPHAQIDRLLPSLNQSTRFMNSEDKNVLRDENQLQKGY